MTKKEQNELIKILIQNKEIEIKTLKNLLKEDNKETKEVEQEIVSDKLIQEVEEDTKDLYNSLNIEESFMKELNEISEQPIVEDTKENNTKEVQKVEEDKSSVEEELDFSDLMD